MGQHFTTFQLVKKHIIQLLCAHQHNNIEYSANNHDVCRHVIIEPFDDDLLQEYPILPESSSEISLNDVLSSEESLEIIIAANTIRYSNGTASKTYVCRN